MTNQQGQGLILIVLLSTFLTTASLIWYIRRRNKPLEYIEVGKVCKICIHPIKSCGGVYVQKAECTDRGIKAGELRDRKWMLVDKDNKYLVAKNEPSVALIKTSLSDDAHHLVLSAKGHPSIQVPLSPNRNAELVKAKLHESIVYGYDCGEEACMWISNVIKSNKTYRMIVHDGCVQGRKFKDHPVWKERFTGKEKALYQYMTQFHVNSIASLDELNHRMEEPLGLQQFRGNITVTGSNAFAEDHWTMLKIGSASFYRTHDCGRCPITMIDRENGKLGQAEPLRTLRKFRMLDKSHPDSKFQKSPVFGVNFNLLTKGNIEVGDTVYAVLQ
ncbi:mitochondrial amidoxime reducing component 2-like [Antedon mediterranea]|uniref:mitochondrial amidoxime reducing component 2-like n=1 Tax=Antedon mediterranea TaxID=105859 RepID=UPI003AF49905